MHSASATMTAVPLFNGRSLPDELAYNEMTVETSGAVMDRKSKMALREKYGFCIDCIGVPVQLYEVKRNKLNPLWPPAKTALSTPGKCDGGKCFVCHPELDPDRRARHQRHPRTRDDRRLTSSDIVNPASSNPELRGHLRSASNEMKTRSSLNDLPTSPVYSRNQLSNSLPLHLCNKILDAVVTLVPPGSDHSTPASSTELATSGNAPSNAQRLSASTSSEPRNTSSDSQPHRSTKVHHSRQSSQPRRKFEGVFVPEAFGEMAPSDASSNHFSAADLSADLSGVIESIAGDDDNLEHIFTRVRQASLRNLQASLSSFDGDELPVPPATCPSQIVGSMMASCSSGSRRANTDNGVVDEGSSETNSISHREQSTRSLSSDPSLTSGSAASISAPVAQDIPSTQSSVSTAETCQVYLNETEISKAIDELSILIRDMISAGGGADVVAEIILDSMRRYTSHEEIQAYCLRAIWDICKDDEQQKEAIMSAGASEDIIKAMRNFSDSETVLEKGCGALWSLGVNANNRIVLVRAGACERIVASIGLFVHVESLVRTAIGALRTLSPELEAREAFKSLGASKVTAKAMGKHLSCVSIQRDGCAFLSNCAVNIEKQIVAIVPFEELNAIVQAMANHREEVSVMQGACFALKNFTYEEKNCRTLRLCDEIDELMAHASLFGQSPTCPDDAGAILERMQMSRAADESIEDQAHLALVALVESQAGNPPVQRVVEFMRSYEWSPRLIAAGLQGLRQICSNHRAQVATMSENSIIKDVMNLLREQTRDTEVAVEACEFISFFAKDSMKSLNSFMEAGACTMIFDLLARHMSNERVAKEALDSLKPFASRFEFWFGEDFEDRQEILKNVLSAHPHVDAVQVNGVAIMSCLEQLQCRYPPNRELDGDDSL